MTSDKPIKLGLMPPLTGLVEIYGPEISWAGQVACREVNENGGVLGRPLELVIEDDGSLPESSVAAAEKLVKHHRCSAIIGNLLSNSRIAVAYRVAEPLKIPYLNFSFYEGSIMSRYFFHFAALPNQQINRMIPYMREKYGPRMFFAGNNYEWPRGSIDAAKKSLAGAGGEVVGEQYLPIGVPLKYIDALLKEVAQANPDVFVPYFAGQDQVNLLTEFTKGGLKKKMVVVMGHYDEMMASYLPPEVREGFYSSNTYFMNVATEENRRYMEELAELPDVTGIWPEGNGILTNFGEGVYLCVKAFAAAANKAMSIDPEALVDSLESVALSGPQGKVEMDPVTHHAKVNTYLSRCNYEGTFEIIKNFGSIPPVMPERYRHMKISEKTSLEDDIRLQARMMEYMTEGICLVNSLDGRVVYTTIGFEKMFLCHDKKFIGRHISDLMGPANDIAVGEKFKEMEIILLREGTWEGELKNIREDGSTFWCQTAVKTFTHAEYGEVWMFVFRDISEIKEKNEMLRVAKNEAEKANESKSTFLATMSHEIRTPLNSILGLTEVLMDSQLNGEQLRLMQVVSSAGETLLSLINDILDLSRIDSGAFTMEQTPFVLADQLEASTSIVSFRAREKGVSIDWDIDESTPHIVVGDAARLNQILINLLSNAVKFTNEGSVKLSVGLNASSIGERDGKACLFFSVSDNGIGIPPDKQEVIFEPFMQTDHSITRKYGGTGLGLAITKRLVTMMDGDIGVESRQGKGSTFYFTLQLPVLEAEEKAGALLNVRVLVFGREKDKRMRIRRILSDEGALIEEAGDSNEALEILASSREKPFNMVVGNCDAEADSGCTFGEKVRAIKDIPQPAILLSVKGTICRKIERGISTGIRCGMLEPLQKKELLREAFHAMSEAGKISQVSGDMPKSINILLVDDAKDNRMLVTTFLKKTPHRVVTAENGLEAIELFKQQSFDLVLMDVQMPVMDGYSATREIREWETEHNNKRTPVLAFTAHAFREDAEKSVNAGCDEHVTKPIKKAKLLELVNKYGSTAKRVH